MGMYILTCDRTLGHLYVYRCLDMNSASLGYIKVNESIMHDPAVSFILLFFYRILKIFE